MVQPDCVLPVQPLLELTQGTNSSELAHPERHLSPAICQLLLFPALLLPFRDQLCNTPWSYLCLHKRQIWQKVLPVAWSPLWNSVSKSEGMWWNGWCQTYACPQQAPQQCHAVRWCLRENEAKDTSTADVTQLWCSFLWCRSVWKTCCTIISS